MATAPITPTAFISYSWDSDDHREWVRGLAEQLRTNGVDVRLDQWHIVPGQSLTQFMEVEVQRCDFVLVICSMDYARKSAARTGGVGYEQQIITGNIAAGVQRDKFIPIVRDGEFAPGPECSIPPQFLGIYAVDMRDEARREKASEQLLRAIYRQPALVAPPIGPRPAWADPNYMGFAVALEPEPEVIRLPSLELDGWQLHSGVVRNQANPDTFEIPEEAQRRSLVQGQIVKLIFEIETPNSDLGGTGFERMWVIVHERSGPYYVGELNNHPASSDEQNVLGAGDRVVFLPEHVISIVDDSGSEIAIAEAA